MIVINKIINYEKEIIFKTNISEITSISLEHQLSIDNLLLKGEFIINGEYKITNSSATVESFVYKLPLEINLDEKYDTEQAKVDIDDFYYEIINNNVLKVIISVNVDQLKEKEMCDNREIIETLEKQEEISNLTNDIIEQEVDENNSKQPINSIFGNMSSVDNYISYNIYIIREGDTLETILEKYETTEEDLKKYNDISSLEIGTKIVIPN